MRLIDVKVQKDFTVSLNDAEVRVMHLALVYFEKQCVVKDTEAQAYTTALQRDLQSLLVE
jgi:hypothetical protein